MRWQWSWWYLLLLVALAWRAIYAYWTPLVNKYIVPPGDDPAFHIARVADFLSGHWAFFKEGYPLGFHFIVALIAATTSWDALTAIRLVAPVLLILPIPVIYWVGKELFRSAVAGAFAAVIWSVIALAPVRAFGDGNYPNMLASGVILPLALLFLVRLLKNPTTRGALIGIGILIALFLIHHLSFVYFLAAAVPLVIWDTIRAHKEEGHSRLRRILVGIGTLLLAGLLLWPVYGPSLVAPFLDTLRTQGTLAGTLGVATNPVNWPGLLEIHNPLLIVLGLAGLLLLIPSKTDQHTKTLLSGWVAMLWLLGSTLIAGLPERFARELSIPLSLTAGYFLAFFIGQTTTKTGKVAATTLAIALLTLDWWASFDRPFALPEPYQPLIRVQHEEELGVRTLQEVVPIGTTILANNSNPYLPFLVHERVVIVSRPDEVASVVAREPVSLIFIGSRPPLSLETIYPFYAHFDLIRDRLLAIPNKKRIETLPTGTEIYRLTQ